MQTRHPLTCFDWAVLCSFSKITWGQQISTRSVGPNVPRGESGLGHISRHRGRLLDPSTANTRDRSTSRSKDRSAIYTMHFDILDGTMLAWLNRELAVPTAGRPLLGCEGGPIVHSFILRGVSIRGEERLAPPVRACRASFSIGRLIRVQKCFPYRQFFISCTGQPLWSQMSTSMTEHCDTFKRMSQMLVFAGPSS